MVDGILDLVHRLTYAQRRAITIAFFAIAVLIIFLVTDFFLLVIVGLVYFLGGAKILNMVIGGLSEEQTCTLPYPCDLIRQTVPKVIEDYYVRTKLVEADSASGRYVVQMDGSGRGLLMTINASKIDDGRTEVNVTCKTNQFFDFGWARNMVRTFFTGLHASVSETEGGENRSLAGQSLAKIEDQAGSRDKFAGSGGKSDQSFILFPLAT